MMNQPGKPPEKLARLQTRFAANIRDPEHTEAPADIEARRMDIYQNLFFNNINGFLSTNFPVIRKLYSDQHWEAMVRDFFIRHRAQTPLFPELPREFLRYLQDVRETQPEDPPFLLELAHYEWVELGVSLDDSQPQSGFDPDGDLLQGRPLLAPWAWPVSYQYPVHQIRPDYQPRQAPETPTHLLVYRNPDEQVKFIVLNPVSARLLQLLKAEKQLSGLDCLKQIAIEMNHPDHDAVIQGGLQQLESFRRHGIILGIV